MDDGAVHSGLLANVAQHTALFACAHVLMGQSCETGDQQNGRYQNDAEPLPAFTPFAHYPASYSVVCAVTTLVYFRAGTEFIQSPFGGL